MKILFYRYGSICEPDVLECFEKSSHVVTVIDEEIYNKNLTFLQSVRLVEEAFDRSDFDCVFSINFFPAISDLCSIYNIRYISWIVDAPVLELFSKSIANPCNRVFVFDRAQYEDIYRYNPKCIFHFPLAVNVESKQRIICEAKNKETASRFSAEVSFVGSLYTEKCPMDALSGESQYLKGFLEAIIEAQLKVYGAYFADAALSDEVIRDFKAAMPNYYHYELENFLTDKIIIGQYYLGNKITAVERVRLMKLISESFSLDVYTNSDLSFAPRINAKGTCKTMTEMPLIFNQSKINLNPTSKAIRSGIDLRAFDIMACEGFMLSNYQSELCELFVPGEDFAYYSSIEEVPEIIDYYLNHESERREIAHNGFEKVRKSYSYDYRLNKLLLTAFEV